MARFIGLIAALSLMAAACSGTPYEPSYGFMLENYYEDGIPANQQAALRDGVLTEAEVEQATRASNACAATVPGIASVEPFQWVEEDRQFSGGQLEFEEGADREAVLEAARACYFEHAGLIEYAWLDQVYFGGWTDENLRG
jgi:hypothetical protein